MGNSSGDENGSEGKKYWEIIADNLSKGGWSWGCVSAVDSRGRTTTAVNLCQLCGRMFESLGA
jgi:hypothetical protein